MCGVCDNVDFVRRRDGDDAARAFAARTAQTYRRVVRSKRGRPIARRVLIEAYLAAKRIANQT